MYATAAKAATRAALTPATFPVAALTDTCCGPGVVPLVPLADGAEVKTGETGVVALEYVYGAPEGAQDAAADEEASPYTGLTGVEPAAEVVGFALEAWTPFTGVEDAAAVVSAATGVDAGTTGAAGVVLILGHN